MTKPRMIVAVLVSLGGLATGALGYAGVSMGALYGLSIVADLPAMLEVLSSLVPRENRAALTSAADRIAMPAPDGPATLARVLARLDAANIELLDIALRRPSLDEVFLALTTVNGRHASATRVETKVLS